VIAGMAFALADEAMPRSLKGSTAERRRQMDDAQVVDLQFGDGEDRACMWEKGSTKVMRVRLLTGAALPTHPAATDVLIVPMTGRLSAATPDTTAEIGPGEALSMSAGTEMTISNAADATTVFLVIRAS
jgi:redox-sensitive bicupin YhaK (pirin superfamily)